MFAPSDASSDAFESRRAWLLLAAGDDRQHGGNDGYVDEIDAQYSWDSTVPRHADVAVGDLIAIWDKKQLLGVSVIEDIEISEHDKQLRKCEHCNRAHIKARKTPSAMRYRCFECFRDFNEPVLELKHVTTYRTHHDAGWEPLQGALGGAELRQLCFKPRAQHSMRLLDWPRFEQALNDKGARMVGRLDARSPARSASPSHGHRKATVRVRVGQTAFRTSLISAFGEVCAFTGPAPSSALEGAHLYSYATEGTHHKHGGLLLRRDIHRLFDDGLLAIHPRDLTIDVAPGLALYETYGSLHGASLKVLLRSGQRKWLKIHWDLHRP